MTLSSDEKKDIESVEEAAKANDFQNRKNNLHIKDYEDWLNIRKNCAKYVMWFVSIWVTVVLWILFITGFLSIFKINFLSDTIIVTLLTTTTIEVLGLFAIVLWNVFPNSDKNKTQNHHGKNSKINLDL